MANGSFHDANARQSARPCVQVPAVMVLIRRGIYFADERCLGIAGIEK